MKSLLLVAIIMAFGLQEVHGNLLNFRKMIKFTTGKEPATTYGFYGCFCGLGGTGTPLDATDRCCATHDCCYTRLENLGCGTKLLNYHYSLSDNTITCEDEDYCRKELCQCDRTAAYCFAANQDTYNKEYEYYSNSRCSQTKQTC
ncbi:phospholipase A2, membrane associated-like [Ochotona princeps]|uniref:phospholipase A2, membrane associated-like n=1 Tax=Ochotona princeps TaxID=9978 RepID=UPI0027152B97|nr:phospholipase A2, membrane associated-like [Ochotona princeps]